MSTSTEDRRLPPRPGSEANYARAYRLSGDAAKSETAAAETPASCPPSAVHALTCTFCRRAGATHLLVWDEPDRRRLSGKIRVTALVCGGCAHRDEERAREIAASPASAWLFRLTPDSKDACNG